MDVMYEDLFCCNLTEEGMRFYGPGVIPSGVYTISKHEAERVLIMLHDAYQAGRADAKTQMGKIFGL